MFVWSRKAKQARERIGVDVAVLLARANDPHSEARQKARMAPDEVEFRHWSQVAVRIAKATERRVGVDVGTRMYLAADFSTVPPRSSGTTRAAGRGNYAVSDDDFAALELKNFLGT